MPVYLIRDLQNFLKTNQVEKFSASNMSIIEQNYVEETQDDFDLQMNPEES